MAKETDLFANVQKFAEAIAMLNTTTMQQISNILQVAALAAHIQKIGDLDMSQALIESKLAQQLNTQDRMRRNLITDQSQGSK
jgi:hypothetical protein